MSLSEDSIIQCEKFIRINLRTQGILLNPYLEIDVLRTELRSGNDGVESNLNLSRKRIESLKIRLKIEELIEEYLLSLLANSKNVEIMGTPTTVKKSNVQCNKLQFEKLCKQFNSDGAKRSVVELQRVKRIGTFKKAETLSLETDDVRKSIRTSRNAKDEDMQVDDIIRDIFAEVDESRAKMNVFEQTSVSSHELSGDNCENISTKQDFEVSSSFNKLNNLNTDFECSKIDALDLFNDKLKEKLKDAPGFSTLPKVRIRPKALKKQLEHVKDDRISSENLEDKESHDSDEEQYRVLRQSYYQSRFLGRFMKHSSREMLAKKAERLSRRFSSVDFSVSSQEQPKMESLTELPSAAQELSGEEDQVDLDGDNGSILDVNPPFISGVLDSDLSSMEDADQKLDMRRLILCSLLDSEQKYVKSLESLLEYKKVMIGKVLISLEDAESIFYKIPELQAIHKEFSYFLEGELNTSREEQFIGGAFKNLAIEEFAIAPNYLKNFPAIKSIMQSLSSSKPNFALFLKEIGGKNDANIIEELLKQPIIQFQKSTYLLNDLIKYTPAIHSDYDLLQKTLVFAKNFVDQIDSHPSDSDSFDKQRYLAKHNLIVEKFNKTRKLRHIFLFNDVIIGAKQKLAARTNSPYEIKWFVPLIEVSLEDRPKLEEDKSLEEDHKEEIAACRRKIKELQNEYQAEYKKAKQSNDNAKIKLRYPKLSSKSSEKIMKKIKDQEAALVMALPCLSFKIFHRKMQKQHILLMSSDYERSDWRETIIGLIGKARPIPSFSVHDAQLLLNNPQMVKATGAVLDRKNVDEEDYLYGSVLLKINRLQGLQKQTNVFCCVEVDSFGHFEKKARTSIVMKAVEPVWDELFEIDLEGTQTLRLLCYSKDPPTSGGEIQSLIGRGAIELRRVWLNNDEKEFTLSLNNKLSLCVTLMYVTNKMSMLSEPTPPGNDPAAFNFEDLTRNEADGIPRLVKCCTKIIEEKGLKEEGIYRISGNLTLVEDLKKLFETDPQKAEAKAKSSEVHTVSCAIKLFFRSLPDSLFTGQLYTSFAGALALKDPDAFNNYLLHIMKKLPKANHATAQHMIQHLIKISREEKSNKMGLKNLSVVFGPTLFRPPSRGGGPASTDQLFFMAAYETVNQVRLLQQILSLFSSLTHITVTI